MPFPTSVMISLPGRPPAPVESAAYFATSELLANIGKHAGATRATVEVTHDSRAAQRAGRGRRSRRRGRRLPDRDSQGWRDGCRPLTARWTCPALPGARPSSPWRSRASCHRRRPRPPPGRPDPTAGGLRLRGRRGGRRCGQARRGAAYVRARHRGGRRTHAADVHRRGSAGGDRRHAPSDRACRCWCCRSTSSSSTPASC